MAQTLQIPLELLPALCCLFEGTHRQKAPPDSLSVPAEEHSLLGARQLRHGEENLGFCTGFVFGT